MFRKTPYDLYGGEGLDNGGVLHVVALLGGKVVTATFRKGYLDEGNVDVRTVKLLRAAANAKTWQRFWTENLCCEEVLFLVPPHCQVVPEAIERQAERTGWWESNWDELVTLELHKLLHEGLPNPKLPG